MDGTLELFNAVAAGDLDAVRRVLQATPHLARSKNSDSLSVLQLARYAGQGAVLDALIDAGPTLSFFEAVQLDRPARVVALLDDQSMLRDVYSDDGFTALHFAAYYGATQVLRILLERGAKVGAMTTNFLANTPLHAAAAGRHMENCRLLLAAGADVNARQHGGFTPLHTPAQHGDRAMAQLFLDHGADPTIANDEGQTPIDLAVSQGNIELAALMRARLKSG